jgi:hypothetical protein
MAQELQSILDYAISISFFFLSKAYILGYTLTTQYIFPIVRYILSNHPDVVSLFLLLLSLYISLLVLNMASRWMYSIVMGFVRLFLMAVLVLGAVWVVKVSRGEDAVQMVSQNVLWAMDKGRQYAWNMAGQAFFNR